MSRLKIIIFSLVFILGHASALVGQNDSTNTLMDTVIVDSLQIADSLQALSVNSPVEDEYMDGTLRSSAVKYLTFEFYLLLFILLAFGFVRMMDQDVYSQLFKKFLNTSLSVRPLKNVFSHFRMSNYILNVLFFLITGLYLYYVMDRWSWHPGFISENKTWIQMLFYIGCVAMTYVVKLSFLSLVGYIFDMKKFSSEYAFNILLVQQVMAVVLYPFLWTVVFLGSEMTKFGIVISIIIFLLAFFNRYARSRESIASLLKLNKFHFFIYLCTSEILPLLVIGKIMIG